MSLFERILRKRGLNRLADRERDLSERREKRTWQVFASINDCQHKLPTRGDDGRIIEACGLTPSGSGTRMCDRAMVNYRTAKRLSREW